AALGAWIPPFVPTAGSTAQFHFYRWLNAFVTDNLGVPATGAGVWSQFGGFRQTAYYPDNGNALCPGATILGYLGKNCANFNVTGADGHALLPVFTDQINTTTIPNAASFGNFEETASIAPYSVSSSVAFDPYPIITSTSNWKNVTLAIASMTIPGTILWSSTMTITDTVISVASSIEITGTVTITNGGIYLNMQSDACNRAVVKITGTGRLNLINSTIGSNCPMTVYVGNAGRLTATLGSALNLDATGTGMLRTDGSSVVTATDSTIDADILAAGANVSFKRDIFTGSSITINTAGRSDLWDANLGAVGSIKLLSDDGNVNSIDFDIRNTTFSTTLTPQLRFGGRQWAQLTSVITNPASGNDFWTGMISGNAKVSRFWWLTVNGVDGTGTILEAANARITVSRLNPVTLTWAAAPTPGVDSLYGAAPAPWPVNAPLGFVIYRASSEERFVSTSGQWSNSTYRGEADATLGAPPIRYYPDVNVSSLIGSDTTIELVFSDLTPELSIKQVSFHYEGNVSYPFEPLNQPINVTAIVNNTGKISVRNAVVSFFSTNVDLNGDGLMDAGKATYVSAGLWIGDFTIALVPLASTRLAWVTWTPGGVAETTVQVSVVVDAPQTDPLDPGAFRELNERNNINSAPALLFVWPDLSVSRADIGIASAIHGNPTAVDVTIRNEGTNDANGASLVVSDDSGWATAPGANVFFLARGQTITIHVTWTPASPGSHTVTATVRTPISGTFPDRAHDFNWPNNAASQTVTVRT
ncbi:MAG TPA: CARDB domain-containing protein, partial [Thermoplasmata archaeon]|nr:CARDB domain-containing protein [Thermoplasmata archaeon]